MRKIKLVAYKNYMRAGCPKIFVQNVPTAVEDDLFDAMMEEVTDFGLPVFVEHVFHEEAPAAPVERSPAPVDVTLEAGEIDTATEPKTGVRKKIVIGQKGDLGKIAV